MRYLALAALLALTIMTSPASASGWFNYQKNTKDFLDWHESSHKLSLRSGTGDGVNVTQTSPDDLWGLRQGDTILSINGTRVDHVDDMLQRLLASKPASVNVHLRSKTGERDIVVESKDYMQIVLPSGPQTE